MSHNFLEGWGRGKKGLTPSPKLNEVIERECHESLNFAFLFVSDGSGHFYFIGRESNWCNRLPRIIQ